MRAYTMMGVLGLGLGFWTTGALSQSAGLSEADLVAKSGSELSASELSAYVLQGGPSKPATARTLSEFSVRDVLAPTSLPLTSFVRKK
jgi:hypothetical protein